MSLDNADSTDSYSKLGIAVRPPDPREKAMTRWRRLARDRVRSDGPAAFAGLQRGDIILGVNGQSVDSMGEAPVRGEKGGQGSGIAHPGETPRFSYRCG